MTWKTRRRDINTRAEKTRVLNAICAPFGFANIVYGCTMVEWHGVFIHILCSCIVYSRIEWHAFQITSDLVAVVAADFLIVCYRNRILFCWFFFSFIFQVTFVRASWLAVFSFAMVKLQPLAYACNKDFQAVVNVLWLDE